MHDLESCVQLFENASVMNEPEGQIAFQHDKIGVTLLLKEKPVRYFDGEFEWGISKLPLGKLPLPRPNTIIPGGYLSYEDKDFLSKADILNASVHCSSFWHPSEDLQLRLQHKRPAVGEGAGTRRAHRFTGKKPALVNELFNTRKLSTVFSPGAVGAADQNAPSYWVERFALKTFLERRLTRKSHAHFGGVLQQVKTRDDNGDLVREGPPPPGAAGPGAATAAAGPLTTLSGTGCDRSVHLQYHTLRDATFWDKGATVGARDALQVDQGIGLGNGVFNRCGAAQVCECASRRLPMVLYSCGIGSKEQAAGLL